MNFYDLEKALESDIDRDQLFLVNLQKKLQQIKSSGVLQQDLSQIKASADQCIDYEFQELDLQDFKLFFENGSRKEYEEKYFKRREAISSLAVMVLITDRDKEKNKYLKSLEEVIWLITNEFTWALPAHLNWELLKKERSLAVNSLESWNKDNDFIEDSKNVIDLFAAETAFALAEITYLLEAELSELIIKRVKNEIINRILFPFSDLKNWYHWESLKMNWSAVCAASIGSTAIYLIRDSKQLARILQRVVQSLEVYLKGFQADGISTEGPSYWNYGFSFYTYFAELLKKRTASKIDLMKTSKLKKMALFQQKFYLTADQVVSFSDTPLTFNFRAGFSSKLKEIYPEVKLPDLEYKADFHSDSCYRWPHIIRDLFWFNPDYFNSQKHSLDELYQNETYSYESDSEWFLFKNLIGEHKLAIAAKAGSNDEAHNHNDLGSFIYHYAGESFLVDPGSGEYTKDYFGSGRYDYLVNSSRGHSTAVIAGKHQLPGKSAFSEKHDFMESDKRLQFSFNLEKAYQLENLISYRRQFVIKRSSGHLIVKDSFKFKEPESLSERFVSFFEAEQIANDLIKLTGKNKSVLINFEADKFIFVLDLKKFTAHSGEKKKLYFMNFKLKNHFTEGEFSFEIFPES